MCHLAASQPACVLCCSAFSPLEGFLNQEEYESVRDNMRLTVSTLLSSLLRPAGHSGACVLYVDCCVLYIDCCVLYVDCCVYYVDCLP
jgi:hypothetical protein